MAKHDLLGYEISKVRLILRIVGGFLLFAITYFFLSYLPLNLEFAYRFAPLRFPDVLIDVISEMIHPFLPLLGFFIAVLVFLGIVFYMTNAYGPILVLLGLASAAYIYLTFHGGMINLMFQEVFGTGRISVSFDLTIIMILGMLPAIFTIIKGFVLTFK